MDNERFNRAVYVISVAAELAGMHPQTLRIYERKGLVEPSRTDGRPNLPDSVGLATMAELRLAARTRALCSSPAASGFIRLRSFRTGRGHKSPTASMISASLMALQVIQALQPVHRDVTAL